MLIVVLRSFRSAEGKYVENAGEENETPFQSGHRSRDVTFGEGTQY